MNITIPLPDTFEPRLRHHLPTLAQRALEAIVVEAYKNRLMSAAEVQQLLNLPSHLATDAFLKQHEAYLPYTLEDIQQDIRAIDQVLSKHDHHQ